MTEPKENSVLIGVEEVATILGMKPATIYTWAQQGKIPAIKMGRTWRFRRTSITAWLDKCESDGKFPEAAGEQ